MTSRIKVLSDETINQIAAGEVVESPASVVKELVENSLDAKATSITVEIMGGGFQLIRISDNGVGMTPDDALLALERHATSKVRKIEDLLSLTSMGFRGEALASIAAISKLTLTTCAEDQNHEGVRIVSEGGKIREHHVFPRCFGTTIEVRSLFYTVPARKKFQKSPAQALVDIQKEITLLALSRPDVTFSLVAQDRIILETKEQDLHKRIQDVLGKDYSSCMMPLEFAEGPFSLKGFISSPLKYRSNRSGQHFFINQRGVTSQAISFAVTDGYATMLEPRCHPFFVLQMTIPSDWVDVNVHPQKKEVRFKEESYIKELVRKGVSIALQRKSEKPMPMVNRDSFFSRGLPIQSYFVNRPEEVKEVKAFCQQDVLEDVLPWTPSIFPQVREIKPIGLYREYLLLDAHEIEDLFSLPEVSAPYNGLVMIHLKRVASRLYYDAVINSKQRNIAMQSLLFPQIIKMTPSEYLLLEEMLEEISRLGIEMRPFGGDQFIIEAIAQDLSEEIIKDLLQEVLEDLKQRQRSLEEKVKKIAISMAHRAGVKKTSYSLDEAKLMMNQLVKSAHPYFCPLGKKIMTYVSHEEYEKQFNAR